MSLERLFDVLMIVLTLALIIFVPAFFGRLILDLARM